MYGVLLLFLFLALPPPPPSSSPNLSSYLSEYPHLLTSYFISLSSSLPPPSLIHALLFGGLAASIAEKLTGIGWGPQPLRARRKRNMRHVSSCSRAHVPLLSNAPPLSYTLALSLSSLSPSTSPLSQCVSLFINRGRGKQPIPNQWPLARQGDCFYDGAFSMGAARGALCEDRARNLKQNIKINTSLNVRFY